MVRLVGDENFNGDIVRGLFRRRFDLDLVRVQDEGLKNTPDRTSWSGQPARNACSCRMTFPQYRRPPTAV